MRQYLIEKILEIPLEEKILLPLDFSAESQTLASKPFSFFFDDVQQLHFSYLLDFMSGTTYKMGVQYPENEAPKLGSFIPANAQHLLNFPTIVAAIKGNQALITEFYRLLGITSPDYKIQLVNKSSVMLDFIKYQIKVYHRDKSSLKIYNPIVVIPFLHPTEYDSVIKFCRENLVNLVIFDFLNFKITTEKEKLVLAAPEKRINHEALWRFYFEQGFTYLADVKTLVIQDSDKFLANFNLGAFPVLPSVIEQRTTTSGETPNLVIKQDVLKNLLKLELKDFCNLKPNDKLNLLKFYFDTINLAENKSDSGKDILDRLMLSKTCELSVLEVKEIVTYLKKDRWQDITFSLTRWNQWVGNYQNWTKLEQQGFLEFLLEKRYVSELALTDLSNILVAPANLFFLIREIKVLTEQFPNLGAVVTEWIYLNNKIFTPALAKCTVDELGMLLDLLPNLTFKSLDVVSNPNFINFIKTYGTKYFLGLNNILHVLPFNKLVDLLALEINGIKLLDYFYYELPKIFNRQMTVSPELYRFILSNTNESIVGDTYAYNLMLGHDYQQLKQVLSEPRFLIKKDTKALIKLKLTNLQNHAEIQAVWSLLH